MARHKLTGFAWLSYCIDFSLFVGVGTIFLMVAPFFALRPTSTCEGVCHNFNCSTKCSQDPCPFSHRCKICGGDHPPYQARPIKSSQTAEVLQSYMYKPHTPTNVPFLHNLLNPFAPEPPVWIQVLSTLCDVISFNAQGQLSLPTCAE